MCCSPDRPTSARLSRPAEGDVGDPAGAVHGLNLKAVFERLQPIPEPLPAAQHDGHHDDVHVVDQVGGQELADSGRAAADADVTVSGGVQALPLAGAELARSAEGLRSARRRRSTPSTGS